MTVKNMNELQHIWDTWVKDEPPFNEYDDELYPLYFGNVHADVFVVAEEPAYNIEDTEESDYILSPKLEHYPKANGVFQQTRKESDDNVLIDVLTELTRELDDTGPFDTYFTNVKKIPGASQHKQWNLFLQDELRFVDPNVVVAFGREACETLYALHNTSFTGSVVDAHGVHEHVDGVRLLPLVHWVYAARKNWNVNGDDYMNSIAQALAEAVSEEDKEGLNEWL